jgi:methylenetetrahydrofolate reductase (NADPH)
MEKKAFSDLAKMIEAKKFVFTGELEPHRSCDLTEVKEWATTLKKTGGITAANVTDNPRSDSAISSLVAAYLIQRDTGLECVYQLRVTDRNRLALVSDILGAGALGLHNILALAGDHTRVGTTPKAKPVFDLDSANLVDLIHRMVYEGKDLDGNEIAGQRPEINVGVAGGIMAEPLEMEVLKLKRKAKVGADFIQTQAVFDVSLAVRYLKAVKEVGIPTLIGIFPPRSYAQAEFFGKFVPGVVVPKEFLDDFKKMSEITDKAARKEKVKEYNVNYFVDFIKEIRKEGAAGCHIMAVGYPDPIAPIMEGVIGK